MHLVDEEALQPASHNESYAVVIERWKTRLGGICRGHPSHPPALGWSSSLQEVPGTTEVKPGTVGPTWSQ